MNSGPRHFYPQDADHFDYQPDFVAEMATTIYVREAKASNLLEDPVVLAKKEVAVLADARYSHIDRVKRTESR